MDLKAKSIHIVIAEDDEEDNNEREEKGKVIKLGGQ
jgi:hypothetical protein